MGGVPWLALAVALSRSVDFFTIYVSFRQEKRYRCDEKVDSELEEIVKPDDFKASCAYHADEMHFELLQSGVEIMSETLYLLCGFYPYLWSICEGWVGTNSSEAVKSMVFLLLITFIKILGGIPWDLYSTFVIQERHGFNKSTGALYFTDLAKTSALIAVLTCVLVPPFIWLVRWAGPNGFLYVWIMAMAVTFLATFLIPTLVMPLFNKYEPLHDEELREKVEKLADEVDYPLTKLFQMDASKRSSHSNAFMYGFWKNKRIVLFDTLLKNPHDEIVAVLAHEMGHWKLGHTLRNLILGAAVMFLQLWVAQIFIFQPGPYESFGFHGDHPVVIGAFIFSMVLTPLSYVLNILITILSRFHEFQADAFAAELGRGEALRKGLIRLGIDNKMAYNVDWLYAWVNYSHPALVERLRALDVEIKKAQ